MRTKNWKWFAIEDDIMEYGVAVEGGPIAGAPSETIGSVERRGNTFHWRVWRVVNEEGQAKSLKKAKRQVEKAVAPFVAPYMSDEAQELAQVGYRAYKNLLGDQGMMGVDVWSELAPVVRRAWAMAGLAIIAEVERQLL